VAASKSALEPREIIRCLICPPLQSRLTSLFSLGAAQSITFSTDLVKLADALAIGD
jgi:hypothetical protein